jgi:hypothetical protein
MMARLQAGRPEFDSEKARGLFLFSPPGPDSLGGPPSLSN